MLSTVNFNTKAQLRAIEIQNIYPYSVLAEKFQTLELSVPYKIPNHTFRLSGVLSKFAPPCFELRVVVQEITPLRPSYFKRGKLSY